jgi:hypothetical protein
MLTLVSTGTVISIATEISTRFMATADSTVMVHSVEATHFTAVVASTEADAGKFHT